MSKVRGGAQERVQELGKRWRMVVNECGGAENCVFGGLSRFRSGNRSRRPGVVESRCPAEGVTVLSKPVGALGSVGSRLRLESVDAVRRRGVERIHSRHQDGDCLGGLSW
jgi:hypothetical protein